ncbi:Pesticidal crystal cry8Ba protein [Melia azedarach]|uniref:Pesticidal crystal cry8Ba protein n=2 Tax=Melia azedarach TaxID=155640 RepID=A0ACC1XUV7_MELAZ|nr:Pesticidal crystal cry8Ba protein [Melia azedarach]KAJ4714530.1 Pesticidal crystal cry8Ba protein [Melia azedarach]
MFTEGLDGNALKWIRQGGAKKDIFSSILIQRPKHDNFTNLRNGGRDIGLPNTFKFQNGHFSSGVVPVSQTVHFSGNDSGSGSDMDISPDSDDEGYGGKYSVKSSPQDDKIGNGAAPMYAKTMRNNGTAEGELPYSATSTEVSFTHSGSNNCCASLKGTYAADSYSCVTSRPNFETTAKQDSGNRGQQNKFSNGDIPSAPFVSADSEIERVFEQSSVFKAHGTPSLANSSKSGTTYISKATGSVPSGTPGQDCASYKIPDLSNRTAAGMEGDACGRSLSARLPTFHSSGLGPWCAVLSYDACVRLCLNSWAKGCEEQAPFFLNNECALLRDAFGLRQVLLQSEEELMAKQSSHLVSEGAALKSKKTYGKMKVQVRKVKIGLDSPPGCSFSSLKPSKVKVELIRQHCSNLNSMLNSGWQEIRKVRVTPNIPANGSFSQQSLAYVHASTQYVKEVCQVLRNRVTTMHKSSSSYEAVQETYSCLLRLKSISEEDAIRLQPGSGETHVFFPDSVGDDLIVEVQGSKGEHYGRVLAQVAAIADDPSDKLRWWPIYHEPEHELGGRVQLYINYSTSEVDDNNLKCGCVAETVAYDLVLEVAMKAQHFQQRNLLITGPWKWLLDNFASYYGVSDAYTNLRYLSYVMDVATPTRDCLVLVYDLLSPVLMKGNSKKVLSHQENRILGEVDDQIQQILALLFENYKSLDESSLSGLKDVFGPPTGLAAPALAPAVKLYNLLHDILSSEAQSKLTRYFQAAVKKRSRRHLAETDEFVLSKNEGTLMDPLVLSTNYHKMKSLILNVRSEICTDIEIHNQHLLPSFIDLPNLSASIYSVDLCNRLQAFLAACPPSGLSPPVAELVIATADFQRDLSSWNINHIKGGIDAKELFHSYITRWIQDKRRGFLDLCKLEKVKSSGARTQNSTTPFVDDMYDQLKEMLNEYEVIICRWPEYAVVLENAVADVERAIVEDLDKQYADVLSPLKDNLTNKVFGLKYVQKIAKRNVNVYFVPDELGILLNSMKRMLDVLCPKIESQFKLWSSRIADGGNAVIGEHLSEITVMMRAKFRNYLLAVVEKFAENTRMQSTTKLKKIMQDSEETCTESDVRNRMQPLKDLLIKTMEHLHTVVEPHVFILICRSFWDQMGKDVLNFLENKKEHRSWYKSSRFAVSILDDIFVSQMQQLLGNALQQKDLEPPRSIMEVRSMLCKDSVNYKDNNYYY